MPSQRVNTAITWSGSTSFLHTSTSYGVSDAFIFDPEDWEATVSVQCNTAGTPSDGDYINVKLAYTTGDMMGDGGNDYDTQEHAPFADRIVTYPSNWPGENPACATFELDTAALGFKLITLAAGYTSHNTTVKAMVCTHRPR